MPENNRKNFISQFLRKLSVAILSLGSFTLTVEHFSSLIALLHQKYTPAIQLV